MSIAEFSVRKPVTIMMLFFGMLFLGLVCVSKLPQELLPEISYPKLTVVTTYANAAPEEVETLITKVIEESIATVRNLTRIHSSSKEGISLVTAEFSWDTNMDFAALAMREKIDLVKERLPHDAEEPIVKKINPTAKPMMLLSITGDYPIEEILRLTKKFIKDKIEKTEGVASAGISGGREREILVEVDKTKLRSVGIDLLEISKALSNSNRNYPAGSTKEKFYEYLLRTMGEFKNVPEMGETVIGVDDQERSLGEEEVTTPQARQEQEKGKYRRLVLLKNVAKIQDTFKEVESYSRYNGNENISVSIQKQPAANSIQTVQRVRKQIEELKPSLPKGLYIEVVDDESIFIKEAIKGIRDDGVQGVMLAFGVLFFFLKRLWPATIVSLTIPAGFMFVLICMFFAGVSLNIVSLMGLALSIGGIADAPIVVLENIYRRRSELEEDNLVSTIKGTNEVASAVTGGSLTAMAVFFPMIFLSGVEGQLLKQLAFSVIFCNAASNILCLTLVPKLAAQGKRAQKEIPSKFGLRVDRVMEKTREGYGHILEKFLERKGFFIGITLLLFLFTSWLMGHLNQELLPKVDKGKFSIEAKLKIGTRIEITNRVAKKIEEVVKKLPEFENYSVTVGSDRVKASEGAETLGSHEALITVSLKPKPPRKRSSNKIIQELKQELDKIDLEGAQITFASEESLFESALGGGGAAVAVEILGAEFPALEELAHEIEQKLKGIGGLYDIRDSIPEKAPETKIQINKDNAGLYDLSTNDIALTCQMAIKGTVATQFKEEGSEYPIRVRLQERDTDSTLKVNDLWIHSPQGYEVPLKEMATLEIGKAPSEVRRLEQRRVVLVFADLYGRALSEVESDIMLALQSIQLPQDYTVRLGGESAQKAKSLKALLTTILMSILLIYMLMASQFESLIQPFLIMFSVPFSVIGVAIALFLTGTSVNIFSMLGFITLGGMVTNNAIVMFEYINDLRTEGMALVEAVKKACKVRLRPILMSTLVTLIGLLPLALGQGEGGELKAPLAITVVGGLFVSTCLTLLLIPSFYIIVEGFLEKFRKEKA
ncbi:MAG: efflux RND transporter permease subunit [Chlamydiae bacterium]|nr:efflux RND transporter permease subunit [Chlamydiota bacterium]MBI3266983.1 efflux RND transporter permease subunit [Chlamydiota bacterium]